MNDKPPVDWEKVLRAAHRATKVISKSNQSQAIREWCKNKEYNEIVNEIIVIGLLESPDSTRKKFEYDSGASDKDCYIRLVHDLNKSITKNWESRVISTSYNSRKEFVRYIADKLECRSSSFETSLILFAQSLPERDKEVLSYALTGRDLAVKYLSEKYNLKPQSVYVVEHRLLRRLRDHLNLRLIAREYPQTHINTSDIRW